MVEDMRDLLNPRRNHTAYKTALGDSNSRTCIPWLAIHIQEMHTAFSKEPDMVEIQSVPMINFAKWARFHDCIKDIFQHKPPDVSQYRQTKKGVLAYLEDQLSGISVGSTTKRCLEKRSKELEQQEKEMRRQRIPDLHAVGMR